MTGARVREAGEYGQRVSKSRVLGGLISKFALVLGTTLLQESKCGFRTSHQFVASSAQVWRAVSPQEVGHKNDPLWCNVPNITFTAEILKLVPTQFLHERIGCDITGFRMNVVIS